MSSTSTSQPASGSVRVNGHSPLVWALRRTIYGVVILTVTIAAAAWLLYAAIDPAESDAGARVKGQAAAPAAQIAKSVPAQ